MKRPVNISLAGLPGFGFVDALRRILATEGESTALVEPHIGNLSTAHTQLCPQNRGILDERMADDIAEAFPMVKCRLHANTRVLNNRYVHDFADFGEAPEYWRALADRSRRLGAVGYTAHAGKRDRATLQQTFDNVRRCTDIFGIPVGIEGHYPTGKNTFLMESWGEYEEMLRAEIPYALDLSHLNIIAVQTRMRRDDLVREMLAHKNCIEIHVSDNDGVRDLHRMLPERKLWWLDLLKFANPDAIWFSEACQRVSRA
jgi:hypothetical protein